MLRTAPALAVVCLDMKAMLQLVCGRNATEVAELGRLNYIVADDTPAFSRVNNLFYMKAVRITLLSPVSLACPHASEVCAP